MPKAVKTRRSEQPDWPAEAQALGRRARAAARQLAAAGSDTKNAALRAMAAGLPVRRQGHPEGKRRRRGRRPQGRTLGCHDRPADARCRPP